MLICNKSDQVRLNVDNGTFSLIIYYHWIICVIFTLHYEPKSEMFGKDKPILL